MLSTEILEKSYDLGNIMLKWFKSNSVLELFVLFVFAPIVLNTMQMIVMDHFLKGKKKKVDNKLIDKEDFDE